MLALGLSGWVRRFTEAAPMPIVMAMVAGVFLRFGIGIVTAVRDDVLIAGSMVLAFLFLSWSALGKRLPPVLGAMLTGALALFLLDSFDLKSVDSLRLTLPNVYTPVFSWQAMVELVVPLAITVLVVQNGQGFAVLTAAGHKPPMNAIAAACGVGSIVSGLTGAASSCLTGPVNAIISSGGVASSSCVKAGAAIRHAVDLLYAAAAGHAAGVHRGAGRPGHAAGAADGLQRRLQRQIRPGRAGDLPGYGSRRADLQRRRGVLGAGVRLCGLLAAGE
jgi:predicted benzoate:H+ symporter BenE